jgi:hypothetical protein
LPFYPPNAIANGILLSAAAIVNVSLLPSLPSVKVTFEPATNLPFKKPAVVSFAETFTDEAPEAAADAELAAAAADVAALVSDVEAAEAELADAVALLAEEVAEAAAAFSEAVAAVTAPPANVAFD